jgi:hypothetical protein
MKNQALISLNVFLLMWTQPCSFNLNQIKHNQSFQTKKLDFTIILVVMLPMKKPCFHNNIKFVL